MRREDTQQPPAWCLPARIAHPVSRSAEVKRVQTRPVVSPRFAEDLPAKWVCIGFAPDDEIEGVLG